MDTTKMRMTLRPLTILSVVIVTGAVIWALWVAKASARVGRPSLSGCLYYSDGPYLIEKDLDTGNETRILRLHVERGDSITERRNYSLSSDAMTIAYLESRYIRRGNSPADLARRSLIVVNRTSNVIMLNRSLNYGVSAVSLSPNGRMVAVVHDAGIASARPHEYSLNVFSVDTGRFVGPTLRAYSGNTNGPSWSPSRGKLVFRDEWLRPVVFDLYNRRSCRLPGRGDPLWAPSGSQVVIGSDHLYDFVSHRVSRLHLPDDAIVCGWSPKSDALMYEIPSDFTSYPVYAYVLKSQKSIRLPASSPGTVGYPVFWRSRSP